MESISLFCGVSIPKLPSNAPSFTIPTMASRLCFDLKNKAPFSRLSNDSTHVVSIGSISNLNRCNKLLARCGNGYEAHSDAVKDPLKSLLNLVESKEKSLVITRKSEALKLVVDEKYDEAENYMKQLFNGDADVAYEARVAHVEILIHLDKYKEARQFLEKEEKFLRSKLWDGRLCLYKALVHTLDKDDNAPKWWNKYLETLANGNVKKNLEISCRNTKSGFFLKDAKALLKPLLSLKPAKEENNSLVSNIIPIKNEAVKKVVNGEYDKAKRLMIDLCEAASARDLQEALEAQIQYIHILIYLDKYDEALALLTKIEDQFPESDARPCLYKAIGLTVSGNHEDAKICWKVFMETIGSKGLPNPNQN